MHRTAADIALGVIGSALTGDVHAAMNWTAAKNGEGSAST